MVLDQLRQGYLVVASRLSPCSSPLGYSPGTGEVRRDSLTLISLASLGSVPFLFIIPGGSWCLSQGDCVASPVPSMWSGRGFQRKCKSPAASLALPGSLPSQEILSPHMPGPGLLLVLVPRIPCRSCQPAARDVPLGRALLPCVKR